MPIYSKDSYMPLPTDIPKYDQFNNPIDSNSYIAELENETIGIYLPEKIHNYSNFYYDSDITISLVYDIEKIQRLVEVIQDQLFVNYSYFTDNISCDTKTNFPVKNQVFETYFPNISSLSSQVGIIIQKIKNIINATWLIDSYYNDVTISFQGESYFLFSQYSYTTYDDYKNMSNTERMKLRDGGILFNPDKPYAFSSDSWDIARSSCSTCATLNAVFNLFTPTEIITYLAEDPRFHENSLRYNSLNAGVILTVNQKLIEGIENNDFVQSNLTNNRYLVPQEVTSAWFGDKLETSIVEKSDYFGDNITIQGDTITKNELYTAIRNNEAAMVVRIKSNNDRFTTGEGHYLAVIDYKEENGIDMVFVADSATLITDRSDSSLVGTDTNRTGWVPLSDLEKNLRSDNTFTIITRIGGENE